MKYTLIFMLFLTTLTTVYSSDKKLKWGLLSTARINGPIIDAIRKSQNSTVEAVASRSQEKADSYAHHWHIPKSYGSYEQLVHDPEIDVIYNSLPNSMHAEWSIKALNAGKHVLCEKPFVITTQEMDAVEQTAQKNNKVIFEAFGYMHHPQTQKVLELVREGKLGQLRYMHGWFSYYLPPENTHNYRLHKKLGGGCLWDAGCYPISLAVALAQDSKPEKATAKIVYGQDDIDIVAAAQLEFADNFTAHIFSSFRAPFQEKFIIVGTNGSLTTNHAWRVGAKPTATELVYTGLDGKQEIIIIPAQHRYIDEIEAMESCVLYGKKPVISLTLSRSIVSVIESLLHEKQ